ncbi:hypothetical protein BCV70DRAFT_200061 [Testicularia cyperi]|uniref:Uncharacterized protein n=1 Tax=Testicularia cyperi TaxID=1882483 RepID=A0A317XSF0_9BASI|nr:hypothetical protein BCV70DRAFT_200061 [Testicularia cyperi]
MLAASDPPETLSPAGPMPRLPPEIVIRILELAITTAAPCSSTSSSYSAAVATTAGYSSRSSPSTSGTSTPFSNPLPSSAPSDWSTIHNLLYVSRLFYSVARPILSKTLTLDSNRSGTRFFSAIASSADLRECYSDLRRAWFGNISSLRRSNIDVDPLQLKLNECAWYEECPGGFIIGHHYASRPRAKRIKRGNEEKRFQRVSVYWAEEELIEEVRDPEDDSSSSSSDQSIDNDEQEQSSGPNSAAVLADSEGSRPIRPDVSRRRSNNDTRDPRIDRPHEPAWQTLYSRRRSSAASRPHRRPSNSNRHAGGPTASGGSSMRGPAEGDLNPWEMEEAQERLATSSSIGSTGNAFPRSMDSEDVEMTSSEKTSSTSSALQSFQRSLARSPRRRAREIYAYHLTLATLEPWINTLFSSLRSLRMITLTFTPGHILDDDKLEHMLRRILSIAENPKLEVLLIRMVFEASVAGSRMRRFERAKTIGGAVDRIGDERIRVMLMPNVVGEGILVNHPVESTASTDQNRDLPSATAAAANTDAYHLNPLSRRAVALTKEGWWSRVLRQNQLGVDQHHPTPFHDDANANADADTDASCLALSSATSFTGEAAPLSWTHFFGHERGRADWMARAIAHADPFPDDPNPLEARPSRPSRQPSRQPSPTPSLSTATPTPTVTSGEQQQPIATPTPAAAAGHARTLALNSIDIPVHPQPATTTANHTGTRQLHYFNAWAAHDRHNTNAPIEE